MENKEQLFDPVCGMDIYGLSDLKHVTHAGKSHTFCGDGCEHRFKQTPDRFLGEPLIRLENVWKVFDMGDTKTEVLKGVNLRIWEGDFTTIIGASGSGKSTLLNMIGLLDRPTSGKVFFRGKDVSDAADIDRAVLRSAAFGFVFQQYNLIPWLSALENATLPLIFAKGDTDGVKMLKKFEEIGLKDRVAHRPTQLSGGEQQRTAILRALANNPEVILGDEPTGNLDSKTGNKILEMLISLNRDEKKTLVIVTHDADIAEKADEIVTVRDGEMLRDHHIHKRTYTEFNV
jgi:putative ABC transport system ATP-binding protein